MSDTNVLKKKAPMASIPDDYIWPRGPVQDALEGARAIVAPPIGYHNLLLCAGAEKLEYFTNVNHVKVGDDDVIHPIEKLPWPFADDTVLKSISGRTSARFATWTRLCGSAGASWSSMERCW